jgi:hypothetical protein
MLNWFAQQARDLVSSPTVQMGQPISTPVEEPSVVKKKRMDEETEEGFVCVANSSFYSQYSHAEQPAIPFSFNNMQSSSTFNAHQGMMYPVLPSPTGHAPFQKQDSISSEWHEALKNVPFELRSDLRPIATRIFNPLQSNIGVRKPIDWKQYEYSFELENSVIREVRQHYANR